MSSSNQAPLEVNTSAEAVGLDQHRLDRIDAFVKREYLDTQRYPGYSLLIAKDSKIAHVSHQGYNNDDIFRIFSMSKPITSIALLGLVEQGLCQLDHPVSEYIASFANPTVYELGTPTNFETTFPQREMTIRDLLTHTSGLTYSWMHTHPVDAMYRQSDKQASYPETLESFCDRIGQLPLMFSPGSRWSYSVATDVCGRLIEVISGQTLDVFLKENLLDPIGMIDTGFGVRDGQGSRLTEAYARTDISPFPFPSKGDPVTLCKDTERIDDGGDHSPYQRRPTFLSGGGGLVGTLADYHRFTQMLLNGGELDGERVIGRKTLEYAAQNHLPGGTDLAGMGQHTFGETNFHGVGFGLGFSVTISPSDAHVLSSEGDLSWGGAASTLFWVDPSENLAVVGMTQLLPSSAYPIRSELRNLVSAALT